ncbi:MAG: cytochrome P450, partial [Candidatus Azotimanducaceae bacterium]
MLLMDEPDHRRLRSLVSHSFTPAAVERWRPRTQAVVARVLDNIIDNEFDIIADFAGPIPTIVIAGMLGVDPAMQDDFKTWSDTSVISAFNPFATKEQEAASAKAGRNLHEFFEQEINKRQTNLGDDLLSDMIRAEEEGEKLSVEEIITQANLLLIAGNITTTDLIGNGNGVKALLDYPEQWESLKADPSQIKNAVEEMLRFDSPVVNSGRIAKRPVELAGCPVVKGESLSASLAAANHDP